LFGLDCICHTSAAEGIKQMGEKGTTEQQKLMQMVNDPNVVSGTTVTSYRAQGIPVKIDGDAAKASNDAQMYRMKKEYNTDGSIKSVEFTTINMAQPQPT
jgi:hypothetical protein